jgi:hypothetical protein
MEDRQVAQPNIKPWVGYTIDRFGDTAIVTIRWYWFEGEKLQRKLVEQYETLSRGATNSARRSIKHIEATQLPPAEAHADRPALAA